MAGSSGSSRLLRATIKTYQTDSGLGSSSASGNNSPYYIPSLKSPWSWEVKKARRIGPAAGRKSALITKEAPSITPDKKQGLLPPEEIKNIDLLLPLAYEITRRLILRQLGATWLSLARQHWTKIAEAMIHKVVLRCQSFTLIGVAGSLVGSVPCFLEGCAVVMKSFFMRFCTMSQNVDQGEIMKLLIEALDMFLVGTALLTFGMGLYIMFYGYDSIREQGHHVNTSQLGAFNLKKLKEGTMFRSITQAKTRIGHAILLLLQAGVLEKFKSVPLTTGFDVACFAGAVLASSAGVFILSKLIVREQRVNGTFA